MAKDTGTERMINALSHEFGLGPSWVRSLLTAHGVTGIRDRLQRIRDISDLSTEFDMRASEIEKMVQKKSLGEIRRELEKVREVNNQVARIAAENGLNASVVMRIFQKHPDLNGAPFRAALRQQWYNRQQAGRNSPKGSPQLRPRRRL